MNPEEIEQMMRLCYRIQVEEDPKVFTALLAELNELVKNRVTSHQRKRKIEVRYDMEQLSGLL